LAGALAGVVSATLSTPADFIKIQHQVWGTKAAPWWRLLKRQPFTGHLANVLREGTFTSAYLGLYEIGKRVVAPTFAVETGLLAAMTGTLAWVASLPFDAVKTFQQMTPPRSASIGIMQATEKIWRDGGARAFFAGIGPGMLRAAVITSLRLVVYDRTMLFVRHDSK